MRKRQRGTTKRPESFRKSSVSLEMTPILDQSPLYLNMESCIFIYMHEKLIIYKEEEEEEEEKDKGDEVPGIDESQSKHCNGGAGKDCV